MIGHPGARAARLARLASPRRGHGQALTAGALRIQAQPLRIGHRDQDERAGAGRRAALIERALTNQALIHPTARWRELAECGQRDGGGCLRDASGSVRGTIQKIAPHLWQPAGGHGAVRLEREPGERREQPHDQRGWHEEGIWERLGPDTSIKWLC